MTGAGRGPGDPGWLRPSEWTPTTPPTPTARGPGPTDDAPRGPTPPATGEAPLPRGGSARAQARRRRARRHRRLAAGVVAVALVASAGGVVAWQAQSSSHVAQPIVHTGRVSTSVPGPAASPSTAPPAVPSSSRTLQLAMTITGNISPKSVAASGSGCGRSPTASTSRASA